MSEKPSKAEVMTEVIKDSVYEATTDNAGSLGHIHQRRTF